MVTYMSDIGSLVLGHHYWASLEVKSPLYTQRSRHLPPTPKCFRYTTTWATSQISPFPRPIIYCSYRIFLSIYTRRDDIGTIPATSQQAQRAAVLLHCQQQSFPQVLSRYFISYFCSSLLLPLHPLPLAGRFNPSLLAGLSMVPPQQPPPRMQEIRKGICTLSPAWQICEMELIHIK